MKLKECPFCGCTGKNLIVLSMTVSCADRKLKNASAYRVKCDYCEAEGSIFYAECGYGFGSAGAANLWNKRA